MVDLLATRRRRKLLFGSLYLSEGAPIGFIWLALPTQLRASGVEIERITWLTAVLVLPWTFKFAWAPLVDLLRTSRWTLRHWIVSAQVGMGATLLPLCWLDPVADFATIAGLLVIHALLAATQDVSIDALCISTTEPEERGQYNGWMQAGMLLGRALMGGGALVMSRHLGPAPVVLMLVGLTTFSALFVWTARLPGVAAGHGGPGRRLGTLRAALSDALRQRNTWIGLAFALLGGAVFKSLEVVFGPFLVDRGFSESEIGWFAAVPMIGLMMAGALTGGWLADRYERRRFVAGSLLYLVVVIGALAGADLWLGGQRGPHLLVGLAASAFGIGFFTAASYALFMDITHPAIAATQFSAFMGATNGCESWSSYAIGQLIAGFGYPPAIFAMCLASLLALPLLGALSPPRGRGAGP